VQHSEYNASKDEKVHFLQIWFLPNVLGIQPSYEERYFGDAEKRGRLRLIASPDGADASVKIHADAKLFATLLDGDESIERTLAQGGHMYVHIARGNVSLNGTALHPGDGAMVTGEEQLTLDHAQKAEVLVFELK
jgi:hypothetical protein